MPLKRVSQRYVIATSKTVDVAKVDLKDVDDSLFAAKAEREAKGKALSEEEDFFSAAAAKKGETSGDRKKMQERADAGIKLDETTKKYLKAKFSLSKAQRPHLMKF